MKTELFEYINEVSMIDNVIELIPTLEDKLTPKEFYELFETIGLLRRYGQRLCEIEVEEV